MLYAESEKYLSYVRELLKEHAASLVFVLCSQNFDKELAKLLGEYAPPDGCLIIAIDGKVGCVALREEGISIYRKMFFYEIESYR